MTELRSRVEAAPAELIVELRINSELPDTTARIVTCCELGRISTLRSVGFAPWNLSHFRL